MGRRCGAGTRPRAALPGPRRDFPRRGAGKAILQRERRWQRRHHTKTGLALQKRLQRAGRYGGQTGGMNAD